MESFDTTYMRGGFYIDHKDTRIQTYYVPIGLNQFGEDSEVMEIEDEPEIMIIYQEDIGVIPNDKFDEFIDLAHVDEDGKKTRSRSNSKTKKSKKPKRKTT